jgi:hypothetical protein
LLALQGAEFLCNGRDGSVEGGHIAVFFSRSAGVFDLRGKRCKFTTSEDRIAEDWMLGVVLSQEDGILQQNFAQPA